MVLEVADAGMGQIALYNPHFKSFVAMTNSDRAQGDENWMGGNPKW